MNEILENDKIKLEPIDKSVTDLMVSWRNNPKVQQNFIFREKFTAEMHNHWLDTKVKNGEAIQYIIVEKQHSTPIGSVFIRDIDNINNSAEFGILIGNDEYRGKGYGSEATKLFLKFCFERLNFHRIFLRVFANNTMAINMYSSSGFVKEGIFHDMIKIDDKYYDIVFMAIIKKANNVL